MSKTSTATAELVLPVSEDRDHILGPNTAAVTLVEYGDYQCPHCRAAHFVLQELKTQLADHFRLVYRNFPLTQIHPDAERAAEAAEAAGAQGSFWEMHDTLFENQDALMPEDLLAYAEEIGLDLQRFAADLAQRTFAERVREDFISGVRSGVNGTPTFFINGIRHDGPWDLQSLYVAITEASPSRT
jgi:protein-disulfide isomerase